MENLCELSFDELKMIEGGIEASFAYRVGEGIRFILLEQSMGFSGAYAMVYSWQ